MLCTTAHLIKNLHFDTCFFFSSSLENMYKELVSDIEGFKHPGHGDLTGWAQQGKYSKIALNVSVLQIWSSTNMLSVFPLTVLTRCALAERCADRSSTPGKLPQRQRLGGLY